MAIKMTQEEIRTQLAKIQANYDEMMNSISQIYQASAVDTMAHGWISKEGKEKVTNIVDTVNGSLDDITNRLGQFFISFIVALNNIERTENETPTKWEFVANPTRFTKGQIKEKDNGGSVSHDWTEVADGFNNLQTFLSNRVTKNINDISNNFKNLTSSGLEGDLAEIANKAGSELQKFGSDVQEKVNNYAKTMKSNFDTDYTESMSTINSSTGQIRI